MIKNAKNKIKEELEKFQGNQKEKAVSTHVAKMLIQFCCNERFAVAVFESKKTLSDCCNKIMENCGNSISDIEVYRKAAAFYFPAAQVKMCMEIIVESSDETMLPNITKAKRKKKDSDVNTIQLNFFDED